jgi:hypothetical protein
VEWGEDGTNLAAILTAADQGLYAAKENGRNTVVFKGVFNSSGKRPVKYTPEMLGILHEQSIKKGLPNWWAYMKGLSDKSREEALEYARNTLSNREAPTKK